MVILARPSFQRRGFRMPSAQWSCPAPSEVRGFGEAPDTSGGEGKEEASYTPAIHRFTQKCRCTRTHTHTHTQVGDRIIPGSPSATLQTPTSRLDGPVARPNQGSSKEAGKTCLLPRGWNSTAHPPAPRGQREAAARPRVRGSTQGRVEAVW